ncbi:MAG TPA: M14 family zinc carboxypeptidase [Chloroflexia bacterium]|nr:M14 family zinc carboxypeptidase [Chloroflexia bacterium]
MKKNQNKQFAFLLKAFIPAFLALLPLLAAGGGMSTSAKASPPEAKASGSAETLVLRVYFKDNAERDRLAVELTAEEAATTGGYLTVLSDRAGYDSMAARGLKVEIDQAETRVYNDLSRKAQVDPETFFGSYRTVEENYAYMDSLVAAYPTLAEKVDIGDTWCKTHPGSCTQPNSYNGYDMYVLHITNRSIAGPKPVFWFETGIHSREIASPEMATRFMSQMLDQYNTNPDSRWLVDWHDIWVMPHVNPDGHHVVENGSSTPRTQRKNADKNDGCTAYPPTNSSQFGTDLNRNFPFKWACCGGSSGTPCNLTYRGPSSGSEEETAAVANKIRSLIPDQRGSSDTSAAPITTTGIYQSLHTYAALNLYAWGWTTSAPPNVTDLANIGKHMKATNAFPAGNNYTTCQPPSCLYAVDGDSADWGYGERGIPSYTTELRGTSGGFFPPFSDIATLYNENKGMLVYMAKIARTPYLTTRGPDADSFPTTLTVSVIGSVQLNGRINYNWTGNSYLQNVAAAQYYIDTPPWAGGTGVAMSATDGSFNSSTEAVRATISGVGLTPGRHVLFVRGRGVNSYSGFQSWGPVTGVFLDVTP